MDQLAKIQRDIDGLLESTRLDWETLDTKPLSHEDRLAIRRSIAAREVDLFDLLRRKWDLQRKAAE